MYQLLYVSNAVMLMSEDQLREILAISRINNRRRGITGMLVYHEGAFLQLLEGEKEQLDSLFEAIRRDARHDDIVLLAEIPVESRAFKDWSMAFKRLDRHDLDRFPILRDLLRSQGSGEAGVLSAVVSAFLHLVMTEEAHVLETGRVDP